MVITNFTDPDGRKWHFEVIIIDTPFFPFKAIFGSANLKVAYFQSTSMQILIWYVKETYVDYLITQAGKFDASYVNNIVHVVFYIIYKYQQVAYYL